MNGVDYNPSCGMCPKGWMCNEYSLLCEDHSKKYSCAPEDLQINP
jgi:hypothetical protein